MKKRKIFLIIILLMIIPNISMANSDIIVMLDPGHGGEEPGAMSNGYVEKDITWKIATRVKQILDNTPGITGILTKGESETLNRQTRAERAKNNNADLLVSFHINSNDSSNQLSGAEVYITHNTTQKRYYEYSNILGLDILKNLRDVGVSSFAFKPKTRIGTPDDVYSDGTVADYYGIISWPMHYGIPSLIVEHCFINNPFDRANYLNDSMLNKMAEADAKAIITNKELFRKNYYGQINTVLNSMELITSTDGNKYIKGTIDIAEWVDDNCNKPKDQPMLTLKSTDGSVNKKIFNYWMQGITYYYDINVDKLDPNKEYYIEAYLTSEENNAPIENKTQKVWLPEKTFGQVKNGMIFTKDNQIYFEYDGEVINALTSMEVKKINEKTFMIGNAKIEEIVNGNKYAVDNKKIEIILETTEGTFIKKLFSYSQGNGNFYFDTRIDEFDRNKEYRIVTKINNSNNIEIDSKKEKQIQLPERKIIGDYNDVHLLVEDSNFKITNEYNANIQTKMLSINMQDNGAGRHYISGNMQIKENVDGTLFTPSTLPRLTLKTEDGYSQKMYIYHSGNGTYYYDTYIEDLDRDRQYYIEAQLINLNNTASESEKVQKIKMEDKQLGKIENYKVVIGNSNIQFIDISKYIGIINTKIQNISMNDNGAGRHYISGNVQISEMIEGKANLPSTLPSLTLKTEDGYSQKMYIYNSGNGNYYFDTYIEDLDTEKQYYIEAKLTDLNNIASDSEKIQKITMSDYTLGKIKDKKVIIKNSKLQFVDGDKYEGSISTRLTNGIYLNDNGAGRHYISGNVQILEMIEGKKNVPSTLPSLTLKTEDGYSQKMYIYHSENGNYYFDTYVEDLDTERQYYIEAKLTNPKNTANENEKVQKVVLGQKELGIVKGLKVVTKNTDIQFKDGDKYQGKISTKLTDGIYLRDNGAGKHYICGNIQIREVIEGKNNIPNPLPKLTLKTKEGYSQKMYIYHSGNGNYYFDTYIEDLETDKQYYIEAELTNTNNISTQKVQIVNLIDGELGNIKQNSILVSIKESNFIFTKLQSEKNTVEIQVNDIKQEDKESSKELQLINIEEEKIDEIKE